MAQRWWCLLVQKYLLQNKSSLAYKQKRFIWIIVWRHGKIQIYLLKKTCSDHMITLTRIVMKFIIMPLSSLASTYPQCFSLFYIFVSLSIMFIYLLMRAQISKISIKKRNLVELYLNLQQKYLQNSEMSLGS